MRENFTLKTFLRFYYKETSAEQNDQIEEHLENNFTQQSIYNDLKDSVESLNLDPISPSFSTIKFIKEYSRMSFSGITQ